MKNALVTLLTDFGTKDHYVASMKGVILSINPNCTLIDITHHVNPQDIYEGATLLAHAYSSFPKGTIHLSVVDPGVGGLRKPILIATSNYFFLGPDNGLFTSALSHEKIKHVVALTRKKYFSSKISNTFHGRDIFAPVAGHLSSGVKPKAFGDEIDSWSKLVFQNPIIKERNLIGEVLYIDTFGNLISNIDGQRLLHFINRHSFIIKIGKETMNHLKRGYVEGKKGEPMALLGSGGFLEIAIREGNAQKRFKIRRGDSIIIQLCRS
jgi:S-adenosylmethionine hydrolase